MTTILLFSVAGWIIATFIGALLKIGAAPAPAPVLLRCRVAVNDNHVLIGIRAEDEVTFIQINR